MQEPSSQGPGPMCRLKSNYRQAAERVASDPPPLEGRPPAVAERLVPLAHRLLEAGFGRAPLKRIAFGRVARNAVEERAQDLGPGKALRHHGLVDEQPHPDELV